MINILLICVICTFIIDITGAADEIYNSILHLFFGLKKNHELPKPLGCSLCSTFWCSIIYLIITQQFTLGMIAYSLVISTLLPEVITLIYDVIQKIISKTYEHIN